MVGEWVGWWVDICKDGAETYTDEASISFFPLPLSLIRQNAATPTRRIYKNGDALIRAVARDQTASSADAMAFGCVSMSNDVCVNWSSWGTESPPTHDHMMTLNPNTHHHPF